MIQLASNTRVLSAALDDEMPVTPSLVLRFEDGSVARIESGQALLLDGDGQRVGRYTADGGLHGDWPDLVGAPVEAIRATPEGCLIVSCGDSSITAGPDPRYEAWTYVRESREMAIARPGGGIALWGYPQA